MLFNSVEFALFLPAVLAVYYLLRRREQNLLLLAASYLFYGWWDERFLFLIAISTCIDYWAGLLIDRGGVTRWQRLGPSLFVVLAAVAFVGVDWHVDRAESQGLSYLATELDGDDGLRLTPQGRITFCLATVLLVIAAQWFLTQVARLDGQRRRRLMLTTSIVANLGILGFFKYFNFFVGSAAELLRQLGFEAHPPTLSVILPVGISFYTFQTMSYSLDIYHQKMRATSNFFDFALFVSFFPQLVAGPIERASTLLPQMQRKRTITADQFTQGLFLIAFGLLKKVAIADGVAASVDSVFNAGSAPSWGDIACASVLFTIQIYGDFSGYSDIARGIAKLMGFEFIRNFNAPYLSRSPGEYWERWHISLSSWMRDYIYFPLGGSRGGLVKAYRNTMITLALSGLWHGAAWNYVLWGVLQGFMLCVQRTWRFALRKLGRVDDQDRPSTWRVCFGISFFFIVTCYAKMVFRSNSIQQILDFSAILFSGPFDLSLSMSRPTLAAIVGLPLLVLFDVGQYSTSDPTWYRRLPPLFRGLFYALIVFILLMGMSNAPAQFIYFQF